MKKILIPVVALILAICFPLVTFASDSFGNSYWETVMSNMIFYYSSAGYGLTKGYYNDYILTYFDYRTLSTDTEVLNYLNYGSNNLGKESVTNPNGTFELDVVYLWWVPLGDVSVAVDSATFVFTIAISNYNQVTLPSGATVKVSKGSNLLNYDATGNLFKVTGFKDDGKVTDIDSSSFYTSTPYTKTIGPAYAPISPSLSHTCVDIYFTTDVFSEFDALGIKLYCFANEQGAIATAINPYTYFMVNSLSADQGNIDFPGTEEVSSEDTEEPSESSTPVDTSDGVSNEELLQEIELIGSQLSQLDKNLEANPDNSDAQESINQSQDNQDNALESMYDNMHDYETVDWTEVKDVEQNYLADYDAALITTYLSPFISTKTVSFFLVVVMFLGTMSYIMFGKKG